MQSSSFIFPLFFFTLFRARRQMGATIGLAYFPKLAALLTYSRAPEKGLGRGGKCEAAILVGGNSNGH